MLLVKEVQTWTLTTLLGMYGHQFSLRQLWYAWENFPVVVKRHARGSPWWGKPNGCWSNRARICRSCAGNTSTPGVVAVLGQPKLLISNRHLTFKRFGRKKRSIFWFIAPMSASFDRFVKFLRQCQQKNKVFLRGPHYVLGEIVIDDVSLYWVEERKPSSNVSHICYYTVYNACFSLFPGRGWEFGGVLNFLFWTKITESLKKYSIASVFTLFSYLAPNHDDGESRTSRSSSDGWF